MVESNRYNIFHLLDKILCLCEIVIIIIQIINCLFYMLFTLIVLNSYFDIFS